MSFEDCVAALVRGGGRTASLAARSSTRPAEASRPAPRPPGVPVALGLVAAGLAVAAAAAAADGDVALANPEARARCAWRRWRPDARLALAPRLPSRRDWVAGVVRAGLPHSPLTTLNSVISVTALAGRLFPDAPPDLILYAPRLLSWASRRPQWQRRRLLVRIWAPARATAAGGLAGQYGFPARSSRRVWVLGWGKMLLALLLGDKLMTGRRPRVPRARPRRAPRRRGRQPGTARAHRRRRARADASSRPPPPSRSGTLPRCRLRPGRRRRADILDPSASSDALVPKTPYKEAPLRADACSNRLYRR